MISTNISTAKNIIEAIITDKNLNNKNVVAMMHSSPGLGKSSIVQQICDKHDMFMFDLRMAQLEPTDICIPYVTDGMQKWSTPVWFEKLNQQLEQNPDRKAILFLDELTNAPISTQHAGYRLVLDRELPSGEKLHDNVYILAAGNLVEDRCGAKSLSPALANRFASHIKIEPDLKCFLNYAVQHDFDPSIIGFLNWKADQLYTFQPGQQDLSFASPRSWEMASNLKKSVLSNNDNMLNIALSGCVGEATATEYQNFIQYYSKLPDFSQIANGKLKYKVPTDDIGLMFAITSSLIFQLINYSDNVEKLKNLNAIADQLPDDQLTMLFRTIRESMISDATASSYDRLMNIAEKACKTNFERVTKYIKEELGQ